MNPYEHEQLLASAQDCLVRDLDFSGQSLWLARHRAGGVLRATGLAATGARGGTVASTQPEASGWWAIEGDRMDASWRPLQPEFQSPADPDLPGGDGGRRQR